MIGFCIDGIMMRRVLLTGATGFIGFHLAKRLYREGCEIRCLVRKNSNAKLLESFSIQFLRGELNDPASLDRAVEGCDTVFHLAGRVRAKNLTEFLATNRDGTLNLARAASRRSDPPLFVHVSSLAVMGPSNDGKPKRETDEANPMSDYGRSKLEGERVLDGFVRRMPCSIVRPGIVFGEADQMNLEVFKAIKRLGFCPIPGWQDRIYSWIHAADLSELLVSVARSGQRLTPGLKDGRGIYFAASDDGRKLSEIGRMIGKSLGWRRTRVLRCPPAAVWSVSTFYEVRKRLTGKSQPYDWAKAAESMNDWCCSPDKARQDLDFVPSASLPERIDQTFNWYRSRGWI